MIVIESKRKKLSTLENKYPGAIIVDVTSHSGTEMVKFSPFYPHGGIPVPFSEGAVSMSVEGIWQGLKVFNSVDIDTSCFRNDTMKNLKRTVRVNGPCKGHRKGIRGTELLGYLEARKQIYLPSYKWVLDHKVGHLVDRLRSISESGALVLLDYETNPDVLDSASPLSHAALIKSYIEGTYPVPDGTPEEERRHDTPPVDTCCFESGQRVRHPKFGEGKVVLTDIAAERVVVDFDTEGQKTLSLRIAKLEVINS
jgi:hypothetical protein